MHLHFYSRFSLLFWSISFFLCRLLDHGFSQSDRFLTFPPWIMDSWLFFLFFCENKTLILYSFLRFIYLVRMTLVNSFDIIIANKWPYILLRQCRLWDNRQTSFGRIAGLEEVRGRSFLNKEDVLYGSLASVVRVQLSIIQFVYSNWLHFLFTNRPLIRLSFLFAYKLIIGKSTLACTLSRQLHSRGNLSYVLDGDNLRHGLNKDLGFKAEDRVENIRRVGRILFF